VSRLLFLLPTPAEPADAGAKIRNRGFIELLRESHEVDTLALDSVVSQPRRSAARRARDLVGSRLPDMALRLWSPEFMARVARSAGTNAYDAVQAEGIEMGRYLSVAPPERRIYDAHNAEFLLQRRLSESDRASFAERVYSRIQWRRLERFEQRVVQTSRMTLATSDHDGNQLRALAGPCVDIRVVPNAIDAHAYPFQSRPAGEVPNLLFIGKLDFRPNADAVRWFLDHVMSAMPNTRLFVVGAAPPKWLVQAGQRSDRVAVTGYVADDRPYVARASALVMPLRSGGGSRLKALIAMASGVPIVSTRVGMEGLEAEPGVHFLCADTASEWLTCLRRLRAEPGLAQSLAQQGRALVERCYDWSAMRARVREAYAWLGT
jgi:polysaccharide biosynthesis protein PslH